VLQRVAVRCTDMGMGAEKCLGTPIIHVCCSVLQCVAVRCCVVQCVAACYSVIHIDVV